MRSYDPLWHPAQVRKMPRRERWWNRTIQWLLPASLSGFFWFVIVFALGWIGAFVFCLAAYFGLIGGLPICR